MHIYFIALAGHFEQPFMHRNKRRGSSACQAELNDGQGLLAVNDLFIGPRSLHLLDILILKRCLFFPLKAVAEKIKVCVLETMRATKNPAKFC